jgi:hypothetical protein
MAFPDVATYNFCPNPSFIDGTAGVVSLNSAAFFSDPRLNFALNVSTPGNAVNEGVQLPVGLMQDTVTGAASLQIQGSGTLLISAVDITASIVLSTTTVTLDPTMPWYNIQLTGLSLTNGDNFAVIIETPTIQSTQFWVTKVQYEPQTTANGGNLPTPYCDGDQPNCFWTGAQELSPSYKPFEYMISGAGLITTPGVAQFLASGEIVFLVNANPSLGPAVAYGGIDCSGIPFAGIESSTPGYPGGAPVYVNGGGTVVQTGVTEVALPGGLQDFAIWSAASDIDPALVTVGLNNAGTDNGTDIEGASGWQRIYGRFSVPNRLVSSAGWYTWNSGVYLGLGFDFTHIASGDGVNLAYVQTEISRMLDTGPSAYQRPRALVPVIGPTTANMVTNPAFASATTGWYAASYNASISLDSSHVITGQTNSLEVTTTVSSGAGAYTILADLVVGQEYTFSGYIYAQTSAITAVTPFAGSTTADPVALTAETWTRVDLTFTATESNTAAGFLATGIGSFDVAETMCSLGELVAYGDGNSDGWYWESTVGLSRSYYYERIQIAAQFINDILTQHIPLGQYFYDAEYFQPMAQVTS